LKLGKSYLTGTRIAYGCWRLAGSEGGPRLDEADGLRAVHAAFDAGYTLFDHADIYGRGECERIFGRALREASGMRQRIVIATKCGICPPWDGRTHCYDSSSAHIIASVEGSLGRLEVDFVDLLMIHRPDYLGDPVEIATAFARLRAHGKVREFGVSNFRPSQLAALQKACAMPLIVNQVEVSLAALGCFDDGTLDQCIAEGITPMAWSPLAKGSLLAPTDDEPGQWLRTTIQSLAVEKGATSAAIALAWLLRHPSRMIPVIGSMDPVRIREATRADSIELTHEEWYCLLVAARGKPLP
jgi:predicted oxidoreductase